MKIAIVFPGQGSQFVGMGKGFFDVSAEARDVFALAEKNSGLPLSRLCFEGPMDELTQTVNLQPAITAVNMVCWQALKDAGVQAAMMAGHSLGEYSALAASGTLSLEKCFELVAMRGRLMDREAQVNPGAMAAIMGAGPDDVAALCDEAGGLVQPANFNTPQQTVITGAKDAVAAASALAKEKGLKAIPLKVSGAWHSPLMQKAADEMAKALQNVSWSDPDCPVAPNTTGRPTGQSTELATQLAAQITAPVRWVQTIEAMLADGVDTFIEVGPKNVLAGLIKKTAPKGAADIFNIQDPESLDKALGEIK